MNELNTTTHDLECWHDVASIDLEQLLTSALPRKTLLPLVKARVKLVIAEHVQASPLSGELGESIPAAQVVDYLRGARAIALEPELCTLMARVGFDKALFTYGHADGSPVGYAEGMWLLQFVELAEKGPSLSQDVSWLRFLGVNATKH